jgi:DNA-binding transcriptional ArsR family regulator
VGQALADPTRRAVLAALVSEPGYPAELAEALGVSRSALSNHLACLRGCGLVTATYEGRRVRYELADERIAEALVALSSLRLGPCPEDRAG